ncbi:AraC family transcriptional regulator [Alsobacter sp. R-9]
MTDIEYRDPDEALAALRGRTGRVRAISALERSFRLRYRTVERGSVHLSRTWEPHARFTVDGEAIPVVFFPMAGRCIVATGRETHECAARRGGSFTVSQPASFTAENGYSEFVIRFDAGALSTMLKRLDVDQPLQRLLSLAAMRTDLPGFDRLKWMAADVFNSTEEAGSPRFLALHHRMQEDGLLLHTANVLAGVMRNDIHPRGISPLPLRAAMEFIRERLSDELTVDMIATAAGVSIRQLQHLFRQEHACSPTDFVRNARLDLARQLLTLRKVASVTEAASDSGFGHLGKFAAYYAARFGETPSQTLRRSH